MLIILSLIFIFIENSLPLNSELMGVCLPFITFIIGRKKSAFFIFLAYIFLSLQSDRYFFNFILLSFFCGANYFLFSYIEYSKKVIIYLTVLDIIFYLLFTYNNFDIKYAIINSITFLILNYFYATRELKKEN